MSSPYDFIWANFHQKNFGLLFCFSPCQKICSSARGRAFPRTLNLWRPETKSRKETRPGRFHSGTCKFYKHRYEYEESAAPFSRPSTVRSKKKNDNFISSSSSYVGLGKTSSRAFCFFFGETETWFLKVVTFRPVASSIIVYTAVEGYIDNNDEPTAVQCFNVFFFNLSFF